MIRALTVAAALATAATASPALAANRNFSVTSFTKVRIDGPFRVTLATGVAPVASASGSAEALDHVAIDVEGDTLVVHINRSAWGSGSDAGSSHDDGPVEVMVGTHDLSAAWLNGAGLLRIDAVKGLSFDLAVQGSGAVTIGHVDVDQLKVSISGTAAAKLAGEALRLTAVVRGVAGLDAAGLTVKDATIGAEGPATVLATVTNSASVDARGTASVSLSGNPACTTRLIGSAGVTGCR